MKHFKTSIVLMDKHSNDMSNLRSPRCPVVGPGSAMPGSVQFRSVASEEGKAW